MKSNDCGDLLTFDVQPPAAQIFHLSSQIFRHQEHGLAQNSWFSECTVLQAIP